MITMLCFFASSSFDFASARSKSRLTVASAPSAEALHEYVAFAPVPLTTIHQPCRAIGEAAMSVMLERIARPDTLARDVMLDCRLVVRESCGGRV